jgi:hypothetical protein
LVDAVLAADDDDAGALVGSGAFAVVGSGALVGATLATDDDDGATLATDDEATGALVGGAAVGAGVGAGAHATSVNTSSATSKIVRMPFIFKFSCLCFVLADRWKNTCRLSFHIHCPPIIGLTLYACRRDTLDKVLLEQEEQDKGRN